MRDTSFPAHEPGAPRLVALHDELLSFKGKGNLVARLEMQRLAEPVGEDKLALGGKGCRAHATKSYLTYRRFQSVSPDTRFYEERQLLTLRRIAPLQDADRLATPTQGAALG